MEGNLRQEHIEFFKELLEGTAKVSFLGYFPKNEAYFKEALERASFLRLKFTPMEEIQAILDKNGIAYTLSENAIKREKYFLGFHKDVLDENGKLKISHKSTIFNNSLGYYLDGKLDEARLSLEKYLGIAEKSKKKYSFEKFQDVVSFGEMEIEFGDKALGKFILTVVSSLPRQYSSIDDITVYAAEKLKASS